MPWLSTSAVKKGNGGFASEEHQMWLQTEELHKSNTVLPKVLIPHSSGITSGHSGITSGLVDTRFY